MFLQMLYKSTVLMAAFGLFGIAGNQSAVGQIDVDRFLNDYKESEGPRDQVAAIRALSISVIRQHANDDQRKQIIDFLTSIKSNQDPVIRLNVHVELLKISAAETDPEIGKIALMAANDENINVRRGIMKYVRTYFAGRYEDGEAYRELLLKKLDDEDLEIRHHAAALMHSWGISNNRIVDILLDSLELRNYRASTVYTLVAVEKNRPATVAKIVERLEASDHNAAIYVNLISQMTPQSNGAIETVKKMYESEKPQIRMAVVDAVGRMATKPESSIDFLQKAIDDPDQTVRRIVIPALIRSSADQSVIKKAVLRQLVDPDKNVSQTAGRSIGFFENEFKTILPDIQEIFAGENTVAIGNILDGFTLCGPMAGPAREDLIKLLKHKSFEVKTKAMFALSEVSPSNDVPVVENLNQVIESDQEESVRMVALQTLSQYQPTNEKSKQQFLDLLDNENHFARYACVNGLANCIDETVAKLIIKVAEPPNAQASGRFSALDELIVSVLLPGGEEVAKAVSEYVDDENPFIRSRALRVVANSQLINQPEFREQINKSMADENPMVSYSAAKAVSRLEAPTQEELDKLFALMDPNNRQRTSDILTMFSTMGSKASGLAPRIAKLMNGEFRSRFTNNAKQTIMSLGENASTAIPELISGKPSIPKLESIWAIGTKDSEAEAMLREHLENLEKRIASNNNVNTISVDRRSRIFVALALAQAAKDPTVAVKIIREELNTDLRPVALRLIERLYTQDESLIDDLTKCLPEPQAISTLAAIGPKAKSSLESLRKLFDSSNPEISRNAKRAVWQISESPDLAVDFVRKTLESNRTEPTEILLQYRQPIWDALRFLADKHSENAEVKKLLEQVGTSRFSQLRNFVNELPRN